MRSIATRGAAVVAGVLAASGLGLATAAPSSAATNCKYQYVDLRQEFLDAGGTSCNDLNVSYAGTKRTDISGSTYWGEYLSGGVWKKGAAGEKYMANGTQSPWKVFISSVAAGTTERMRGYNGAFVGTCT